MSDRPRARRCPECNTVNRPTVPVCECGYVFDAQHAQALGIVRKTTTAIEEHELAQETLEDQRQFQMHELTLGWFMVVGGALTLLVSVALIIALARARLLIGGLAAGGALLAKGGAQVGKARRHLRALEGKDSNLPKAKLLSR